MHSDHPKKKPIEMAGVVRDTALHGHVSDAGGVKLSFDSVNPSVMLTDALNSTDKNGMSQE